jgi:hypothetical protein
MTTLEARYRRLLSLYPRRHRELYAEEMIGVLMESADPDRRRPSLEDRMDIVASALVVRLRGSRDLFEDAAWRSAAHLVSLFGAMFLCAIGARRTLLWLMSLAVHPEGPLWYGPQNAARPIVWGLTVAAILAGLQRSATILAIGGVAAEITRMAPLYHWTPGEVVGFGWVVALAATVAAARWWLAAGPSVDRGRPRGFWIFATVMAAIAIAGTTRLSLDWWTAPMFPFAPLFDIDYLAAVGAPAYLVVAAAAGWAWWRQPVPVRRRMVVFAVPVLAVLIEGTFGIGRYSTDPLPTGQWALLAVLPTLAFGAGTLVLNRWERIVELVRRGREAEQREVALER